MRAREFLSESIDDVLTKALYMEGQCGILAIAIHNYNPKKYILGYVYEYNAGPPDMYLDPAEWNSLSKTEKKQIELDSTRWGLVHAFVQDLDTNEYIDATGRRKLIPLVHGLNLTRKLVMPATSDQIINLTTDIKWDESADKWDITRGRAAFDMVVGETTMDDALAFARRNLGIK